MKHVPRISKKLRQRGVARFKGSDALGTQERNAFFEVLRKTADDLPLDPYCVAKNRFRQLSWSVIVPWSGQVVPLPLRRDPETGAEVSEFHQPAELNPDEKGMVRRFAPIPREVLDHPLLKKLILFDLSLLSWWSDRHKPLLGGLHLMKHVAIPGRDAAASPDALHTDGQPFTAVHLIERKHVIGGENVITPTVYADRKPWEVPPEDILSQFTLRNPGQSFIVKDTQVAHYVAPVRVKPGHEKGWRSVLLVDFTPFEPKFILPNT